MKSTGVGIVSTAEILVTDRLGEACWMYRFPSPISRTCACKKPLHYAVQEIYASIFCAKIKL